MNTPVTSPQPIGVDVFDAERRQFLKSLVEFFRDPLVPEPVRAAEFTKTLAEISRASVLAEVTRG